MLMEKLVEELKPTEILQGRSGVTLTGVSIDSRRIQKGHLFAALPGQTVDGANFAFQALEKGAAAILTERRDPLTDLPQLVVPHARVALGHAARVLNGAPDQKMRIGAVTGTNGKSTTAYLIRHLLESSRVRCGMLGTIEYDLGADSPLLPSTLTTPEAPELFQYLNEMNENGCESCIMEVSSHSLCQHRTEGIEFTTGIFTNLSQDHLDYHRTMAEYRDAKGLLFDSLSKKATAVLNMDDPQGAHYASRTKAEVWGYSTQLHPKAELSARVKLMNIHGTVFELTTPWGKREVQLKLVGAHNVQNALAALGASLALGTNELQTFNMDTAIGALERFRGIPGRLEPVGRDGVPFQIMVDYAHTDDALRSVLTALRDLLPSRLIVVFGCGGDRDHGKRPKMGRVVEKYADMGVVTSDNPRDIIAGIWEGIQQKSRFSVEVDRGSAIEMAIQEARPGDVVLIAGKGHEDYQIVGKKKIPFDDRVEARKALDKRYGPEKSGQA